MIELSFLVKVINSEEKKKGYSSIYFFVENDRDQGCCPGSPDKSKRPNEMSVTDELTRNLKYQFN